MASLRPERLGGVLAGLGCVLVAACATVEDTRYPPEDPAATVFVVSHGWHSGIVLRAADLRRDRWPEAADFPGAAYLEVGWGDRDFYQAHSFNPWYAVKALLWPTASVLHMAPLGQAPGSVFPAGAVVALPLSRDGLARLTRRISGSFARGADGRAAPLAPGLYRGGRFYPSRESFHLFKTCNVWTARVLREAGIPVPACVVPLPGCVTVPLVQTSQSAP